VLYVIIAINQVVGAWHRRTQLASPPVSLNPGHRDNDSERKHREATASASTATTTASASAATTVAGRRIATARTAAGGTARTAATRTTTTAKRQKKDYRHGDKFKGHKKKADDYRHEAKACREKGKKYHKQAKLDQQQAKQLRMLIKLLEGLLNHRAAAQPPSQQRPPVSRRGLLCVRTAVIPCTGDATVREDHGTAGSDGGGHRRWRRHR
jgi:hypothetical protein